MYDKEYVDSWIRDHESGKDLYRKNFLEPFLKKTIEKTEPKRTVLDIGCGWGIVLKYLDKESSYYGIDIATDFFDYIRKSYPNRKIKLIPGSLPSDLSVQNNYFDVCICSQVLHTVPQLKESLKNVFLKMKRNGTLIVIVFSDDGKDELVKIFDPIEELTDKKIKGNANLPSGNSVHAEVFFHKEREYEKELSKLGTYSKTILGPMFVGYVCRKTGTT